MKSFKIVQKLNYALETEEKKAHVDLVINTIDKRMKELGFEPASEKAKTIDYIFSIGGDGTMLQSMHQHIWKNPVIVGINAGNVGFLTPYDFSDLEQILNDIKEDGKPRIEKRAVLTHSLQNKKGIAVNDYAISGYGPNDMIEFSVEVEHRGHVSRAGHYRANAVVISGPCGSTAYNMNAGGAIVDPSVSCMQMVMVAPTTLGSRPLIVGKNSKIHIHIKNRNMAKIFSDGILYHEIGAGENETISIGLLNKESNILVPEDWNFYSVLSKKLHWNNGKEV